MFHLFLELPLDTQRDIARMLSKKRRIFFARVSKHFNQLIKDTREPCPHCYSREFHCCDNWLVDRLFNNQFRILIDEYDYTLDDPTNMKKNLSQEEINGLREVMYSWHRSLKPQMTPEMVYFLLELTSKPWFLPCIVKNATFSYVRISSRHPAITVYSNHDSKYNRFYMSGNKIRMNKEYDLDIDVIEWYIHKTYDLSGIDKQAELDTKSFLGFYQAGKEIKLLLPLAREYDTGSLLYEIDMKLFHKIINMI